MNIQLQPPGSLLCGWYAVMNLHAKHGLPIPSLEDLRALTQEGEKDALTVWGVTEVLSKLGWTVMRSSYPYNSRPKNCFPQLLAAGFDVVFSHSNLTGGGLGHFVVAQEAREDGMLSVCSVHREYLVPWRDVNDGRGPGDPPQPGIWHEFVITRPPG